MIHEHSYKPNPRFYKGRRARNETLFMGFELEIETGGCGQSRDEISNEVRRLAPFTYCKRDGSLSSGFEVVSHPLSWRWVKQNKERLVGLLTFLDKAGAKSYDTSTCGLHVHMSKAGLGRSVLESMLKFVFGNPGFILKVSRRNKSSLDRWAKADLDGDADPMTKAWALDPDNLSKPRRLALNTLPPTTAEFRMFKGTLSSKGFLRALEFCHSLAECVKRKAGDVSLDEYVQYVNAEGEEYPHLAAFMRRHRIGNLRTASASASASAGDDEAPSRRPRAADIAGNLGRPTASQLTNEICLEIRRSRNNGWTWAAIEEHYNLRRSNGMTALHAYDRAGRLLERQERSA